MADLSQLFPDELAALIQNNALQKGMHLGLKAKLEYRSICERMKFPTGAGNTLTATRSGYLPAITEYSNPSQNTNLDNGMTPQYAPIEQFTISINQVNATQDLNLVASGIGIADQFVRNAYNSGEQASRSLDALARNALFDGYLGGNTRVTVTGAGSTIPVDDVRGFNQILVNGKFISVSGSNKRPVRVGDNEYNLIAVGEDAINTSKTFGGKSGTLSFDTNVGISDATAGNPVIAKYAPSIFRPNGAETYTALTSSDTLTMAILQDAVAHLRDNAIPDKDGFYNCFIDNQNMTQLFRDPEFREVFRGGYKSDQYKNSTVVELLGLRFITTTQSIVQSQYTAAGVVVPNLKVRRTVICGADTLIEGVFDGQLGINTSGGIAHKEEVDDSIVMVVRPPLDRNAQTVSQSWYSIIGYVAPTDATANSSVILTASDAYLKRSAVIETITTN